MGLIFFNLEAHHEESRNSPLLRWYDLCYNEIKKHSVSKLISVFSFKTLFKVTKILVMKAITKPVITNNNDIWYPTAC